MAKKRFIDTEIWNKEWFMDLSPTLKCLVIYLFNNCDASGVWSPNWRLASLMIGEDINLESVKKLPKNNFEILENGKIFVINFVNFQYGTLSELSPAHKPIFLAIKNNNLQDRVFNRLSNNLLYKDKEIEEEKDKEKETVKEKKTKILKIFFSESEFYDVEVLRKALSESKAPYTEANVEYYHEAMDLWSKQGNKKLDWFATCQNFILGDFKNGKLIDKNYKPNNNAKGANQSQYTNGRTPFDAMPTG